MTTLKSPAESLSLGQDAGKRSIVCSFRLSTCFTFDHSCSGASAYCHLLSCRPFQCDRLLCNWLIPTSCRSLLCSLRTLRRTSPGRTLPINTRNHRGDGAAPSQPATAVKIPSSSNFRRPANIPLHTLSSSSRPRDADSAYLLENEEKTSQRSSLSAGSDFSLWSDTGDLVDQLADEEDPLRIRLRESLEGLPKNKRHQKRVRYQSQDNTREKNEQPGVVKRKEDIEIPDPGPRTISRGERILAAIMAPRDGPSRIHGLHGKKLMYYAILYMCVIRC